MSPPTPSPPIPENTNITHSNSRKTVHVNTLAQLGAATLWMCEETQRAGPKHIASKCVKQFPEMFSGNTKANLQEASRWWKGRNKTIGLKRANQRSGNITSETSNGIRRAQFKCLRGRGRKRSPWVTALYDDLVLEFERLRSVGLKFSPVVLRDHALLKINEAQGESLYNKYVLYKGKPLSMYVNIRWVQHFMKAKRIVLRSQTGKLMVSPEKQLLNEKTVAFHLGELKRGFQSGMLNEDTIDNADETHFVINMVNGKTLGFVGDKHLKYAYVVSGGDPITMMVRLSGGRKATIHPPMLIFKNDKRSYPIRGVQDDIPGVSYRSSPKGWMDSKKCGLSGRRENVLFPS